MNVGVYQFLLGDVDDPQVYVASSLYEWEQSESGRWVKEHALSTPYWTTVPCFDTYSHKCCIVADLREEDITYFKLKWGDFK